MARLTLDQAKDLKKGEYLYNHSELNAVGTYRRWKVNGKVKTWKRMPNRVYVPLKCGLYAYSHLDEIDFDENGVCLWDLHPVG